MVELKVHCPCGTKLAFDVEPVDGRLPESIVCPACNEDATELANAELQRVLPPEPVAAAPARRPALSVSRPASSHPAPPPPPPPTSPGLRQAPSPKVSTRSSRQGTGLQMGIVGALIGGAVGMSIWYAMIRYLNIEIGWIAWGVGTLTGLGARVLAKEGSPALGAIAAITALVAILGGETLGVKHAAAKHIEKMFSGLYDTEMETAKEIGENPNDKDIRAYLEKQAKEEAAEGEVPEKVTAEDIREFRSEQLPHYQELASGKLTKEAYQHRMAGKVMDTIAYSDILKESVSVWTALWLFLGIGSAWKLGSGASDT